MYLFELPVQVLSDYAELFQLSVSVLVDESEMLGEVVIHTFTVLSVYLVVEVQGGCEERLVFSFFMVVASMVDNWVEKILCV